MSDAFEKKNMKLQSVVEKLEKLKTDFPQLVEEFTGEYRNFCDAVEKKAEEGRKLSISIVGRVKSGKSSLLNALIFDGANVLPQAATPMTAALTYICYAPECRAEVEFFSENDWEGFLKQDMEYTRILHESEAILIRQEKEEEERCKRLRRPYRARMITTEMIRQEAEKNLNENYSAAHELVEMAKKIHLDTSAYLGKTETIHAANPEELSGQLEQYVGADGKFTPIVCSTTIYINDERLNGYEIIDTPGTNDPIISRGEKTKHSLAKTDVVFAISPAGRFFDSGDWELLSQNLPKNGVKNFEIIASQYDLAVGNIENEIPKDKTPRQRLIYGMRLVQNQLAETFHARIAKLANESARNGADDHQKWERLVNTVPLCASAQAYSLAQNWDSLSEEERDKLQIFNNLIPGFSFDRDILENFSLIGNVRNKVDEFKEKKAEIIAEGLQNLLDASKDKFVSLTRSIETAVKNSINALETKDVDQLKKELKLQTQKLEKGRVTLEGAFEDAICGAKNRFSEILREVQSSKTQFGRVDVQTESHTEYEDYEVDKGHGFLWWRDLSGNRYETRTRSSTVTTRYADAYAAVDQVEEFANKASQKLVEAIRTSVNIATLKNTISDGALALFEGDTGDVDLDLLKEQIKSAVRRITIPDADFGDVNYGEIISSKFPSSRVEGGDIDALKSLQREALSAVVSDLESKTKAKVDSIEKSLEETKATFVPKLIGDLKADTEKLLEQLKNKEENLNHLKSLLPVAKEAVKELETM